MRVLKGRRSAATANARWTWVDETRKGQYLRKAAGNIIYIYYVTHTFTYIHISHCSYQNQALAIQFAWISGQVMSCAMNIHEIDSTVSKLTFCLATPGYTPTRLNTGTPSAKRPRIC